MKVYLVLATLLIALVACEKKPVNPLVGIWKSDAKKSLASMNQAGDVSAEARELFENDFFGHLFIEYTETESRSWLDNDELESDFEPYEVVEIGASHVTMRSYDELFGEDSDLTAFLEDDCYYVLTSKFNFKEYFCREANGT